MKLLIISQHFYPEEVSTGLHMTELCSELEKKFNENDIDVLTGSAYKPYNFDNGKSNFKIKSKIYRLNGFGSKHGNLFSRFLFALGFTIPAVFWYIKNQGKYDIILMNTNPPTLYPIIGILNLFFNKKVFLMMYDVYPNILVALNKIKKYGLINIIWTKLEKFSLKYFTKIIVIGDDMNEIIKEKLSNNLHNKIEIIRNWANSQHFKNNFLNENNFLKMNPNLKNKKLIIYSGTMGTTHNIEEVLELSNVFLNIDNSIHFVFIGGGSKFNFVKNFCENQANCSALPFQDYNLVPSILESSIACVVCLDSKFTGLSVPSKSYAILSAGKPIIGFLEKNSEIGKMISENNLGLVFDKNTDINTRKINLIKLMNAFEKNDSKTRINNFFSENYTLKIIAGKYYELLTDTK